MALIREHSRQTSVASVANSNLPETAVAFVQLRPELDLEPVERLRGGDAVGHVHGTISVRDDRAQGRHGGCQIGRALHLVLLAKYRRERQNILREISRD